MSSGNYKKEVKRLLSEEEKKAKNIILATSIALGLTEKEINAVVMEFNNKRDE